MGYPQRPLDLSTRLPASLGILALLPWAVFSVAESVAAEPSLREARTLLLRGNYAEAGEIYGALAEKAPVDAALGLARSQRAVGELDTALKILIAAAEKHPKAAALPAEVAVLEFERGRYESAAKHVAQALQLDKNQLAARWLDAELHRTAGRLEEAAKGYQWFVDYYNEQDQVSDPESLRWIGFGAAEFARWNRVSDQFSFLVNELYPDAVSLDEDFWPAHYEAGRLYLEKYNQADAAREFKAALAINPNAAEVYAALAVLALQNYDLAEAQASIQRALEINPHLAAAHRLKAQVHLTNFQAATAIDVLNAALKLNPADEETLGLLAAAYAVKDGLPKDVSSAPFGKLIDQVERANPRPGTFYLTLAGGLNLTRKYPSAARFYARTIEIMPQLVSSRGELGMVYMRLGREVEAEKLLKEAFEIDPFNVRVSNTLKVLDVLSGYAVIETEHFIIKFDRAQDEILARCAAEFLEEHVYPDICKKLAYVPKDKSLFEFFSRAKNTSGHGWFSARMVGLPYVGTVGACAGQIVAMASPNDTKEKFNWARVLKHEFVHVVNLQQTNFNIPHWFTEALAVQNEGYARPASWNQQLADRIAQDKLFNLGDINLAFVRPASSLDWQMAYCQAALYADFMLKQYGDDSLAKMLAAYADNLDTPAAIKRSFGVEVKDFEQGYLAFIKGQAPAASKEASGAEDDLAALLKAHAEHPKDADRSAELAHIYLARKDYPRARDLAQASLKSEPKQQTAAYVLARLSLLTGETEEATAILEDAFQADAPQADALGLLAGLRLKADDYAGAVKLYELGAEKFPGDLQWTKLLAAAYLKMGDEEKLAPILARLAERDPDTLPVRKKLAQLALARKDWAEADRWSRECQYIDVMDAQVHHMRAQSLAGREKHREAVTAYEFAVKLEPQRADLHFGLAAAYAALGKNKEARDSLEKVTQIEPDYQGAKALLEGLQP